jgi:phosphatidylglycerophosphatase A
MGFFSGIWKFITNIFDVISDVLEAIWKVLRFILVIILLILAIYFFWIGAYFYAILAAAGAFIIGREDAVDAIEFIGEVVGDVVSVVAEIATDVALTVAGTVFDTLLGNPWVLGLIGVGLFMFLSGDGKMQINERKADSKAKENSSGDISLESDAYWAEKDRQSGLSSENLTGLEVRNGFAS